MADNLTVTQGTGVTVAADDVGGVLFQRVKPAFGGNGVGTDVSASDPLPVVDSALAALTVNAAAGDYEKVAASATDQALGATGATGDYLAGLLVIPANTSPGAVAIKDGAGSAITVFTGGASSVSNLVPFAIPLGIVSLAGAWKITTGADVSVLGIGNFT